MTNPISVIFSGKNVLNQKSELQKTFERKVLSPQYRLHSAVAASEEKNVHIKEFEKIMAERARRLNDEVCYRF